MQVLSDPKILVTGGAGFIGSHLCRSLLDSGYRVVSIDNLNEFYNPAIKRSNVQSILMRADRERYCNLQEDIRNLDEIMKIFESEKPDAVIHLAALAGVRPSIDRPMLYSEVNIQGTQNVLEACVESGIRHFIFASSSSVYGNNRKIPFSETDNVDFPISPYAATKKAGELLCHTYAHLYGMAIDCLRFFTVYGPGQRPDLAIHKFSRAILDDQEISFFGNGETSRDYTYIDDIISGVMSALEINLNDRKKRFEIFNLGGSQIISLNEMLEALEAALDKKALIRRLPAQPGDVERTCADIEKARKILNYNPSVSFQEGINRFVDWLMSEMTPVMRLSA